MRHLSKFPADAFETTARATRDAAAATTRIFTERILPTALQPFASTLLRNDLDGDRKNGKFGRSFRLRKGLLSFLGPLRAAQRRLAALIPEEPTEEHRVGLGPGRNPLGA